MAMNVLHAVDNASGMIREIVRTVADMGSLTLTTLVKSGRLADRYIDKLGEMGALVPRSLEQLIKIFKELDIPVRYLVKGNLALARTGRRIHYFQISHSVIGTHE